MRGRRPTARATVARSSAIAKLEQRQEERRDPDTIGHAVDRAVRENA